MAKKKEDTLASLMKEMMDKGMPEKMARAVAKKKMAAKK
jgi:hypothetical protein